MYSGTFTYAGDTLDAHGLRVVLQRKLDSDLTATLDYAYGGVLDLSKPDVEIQNAEQSITTQRRQALAAKFSGTVPRTQRGGSLLSLGQWSALTPVDMFNASPGQSDAFLNLFIRQPIPTPGLPPSPHGAPSSILRNLLAQGYVPVIGAGRSDGLSCPVRAVGAWRRDNQLLSSLRFRCPGAFTCNPRQSVEILLYFAIIHKINPRIATRWLTVGIAFR